MNEKCFCLLSRSGFSVSRRSGATLGTTAEERLCDPTVLAIRVMAACVSAVGRMEDESCVS